ERDSIRVLCVPLLRQTSAPLPEAQDEAPGAEVVAVFSVIHCSPPSAALVARGRSTRMPRRVRCHRAPQQTPATPPPTLSAPRAARARGRPGRARAVALARRFGRLVWRTGPPTPPPVPPACSRVRARVAGRRRVRR